MCLDLVVNEQLILLRFLDTTRTKHEVGTILHEPWETSPESGVGDCVRACLSSRLVDQEATDKIYECNNRNSEKANSMVE